MLKDYSIMPVPAFALFKVSQNLADDAKKESDKDIQTLRNKRLAKRCRGRLHESA